MGCGSSSEGGASSPSKTSGQTAGGKTGTAKNNNNRNVKDNNKSGRGSKYETQSNNTASETTEHMEANDKGYKKRLREKLRNATWGTDMDDLEKTMGQFERARLEDCGDYTDAEKRLRYLKLRRDLRDAIRRRHIGVLDKTIAEAQSSEFAGQLSSQIEAAEKLRDHLKELNQYSHDVLEMEQATISELRSYQRPPSCVHDVMAATYMLLGEEEERLSVHTLDTKRRKKREEWTDIQAHLGKLGKDSLIRRVGNFDTKNVDDQTATRVKEILDYHDLDEVRVASNGAGTFHVWATGMIEMIEKDKEEEEEKRRQEEEKSQEAPSAKARKKKG